MSKLAAALREKFNDDPKKALRALGLDESLISDAHTERSTMAHPTRFANLALQLTAAAIKPFLAKDAKIDLMPAFKDVTSKNFDAKKIKLALDSALKGKLAKDAEAHMGHVAQLMDHLGAAKPESADESVSEEQHKAMEAAAHGESTLGIPESVGKEFTDKDAGEEGLRAMLKEKGMADDDINGVCDMMFKKAGARDESPEDKEKREKEAAAAKDKAAKDAEMKEAEEKKAEEDKAAADKAARDAEMKDMVTKQGMDAAIKAATDLTAKNVKAEVIANQRAISKAIEAVRPFVGELSMTFDSADDVYKAALTMKNIDVKDIHPSAFPTLVNMLPKAGARPAEIDSGSGMGMDTAAADSLNKMFPGIDRIQSI